MFFDAASVLTAVSPVIRNVASSQAENHMVRFALKMKRRTLRRAFSTIVRCCPPASLASSVSMRRIPARKGCMMEPSFSWGLHWYFVM